MKQNMADKTLGDTGLRSRNQCGIPISTRFQRDYTPLSPTHVGGRCCLTLASKTSVARQSFRLYFFPDPNWSHLFNVPTTQPTMVYPTVIRGKTTGGDPMAAMRDCGDGRCGEHIRVSSYLGGHGPDPLPCSSYGTAPKPVSGYNTYGWAPSYNYLQDVPMEFPLKFLEDLPIALVYGSVP